MFPIAGASACRGCLREGLARNGGGPYFFGASGSILIHTSISSPKASFSEPFRPNPFACFSGILDMDSLSALSVAGSILAVVEFRTELLTTSKQSQGETLIDQREEYLSFILEKLRTLRLKLSTVYSSAKQQAFAGASQSPRNVIALQELALSCIEDSGKLLGDVVKIQSNFPGSEDSQLSVDAKSWFASLLGDRVDEVKQEQLSRAVAVAVHVRSIVGCAALLFEVIAIQWFWETLISGVSSRISELSKTMESLRDGRRYGRPEQESRIDSMSQLLEDLHQEIQAGANDSDAKPSVFTESEIELFELRLASLTEAESNIIADKIVASLNYDSRPVRHGSVPQAHKDTFQWAFDSRLSYWLRSGSGIFWVSGKPGSGKSTFMKFIASHVQTKELLFDWAGSANTLAVAAHFFWIAGTPIQRSWQGLLQSLLFDVLHNHPSIVPLISPNRWAAAKAGQWQTAAEPWSLTELKAALQELAAAKDISLKICFFIDGLDEFDSDHTKLCNLLCDMARSPHIKMCLSSRPWAVFENSFGANSSKRLDIHELTRNDIRGFVSDQLQTHSKWSADDSEEAAARKANLVERIAAQADGVFLWAFFVTKSLREDLSNGSTIADLHKRVSDLPSDLEQLFKHMLEKVDPKDQPKMAGFLQATAYAWEPLHMDLYWHVEKEFEEDYYAFRCPIEVGTPERISKQREHTIRNMNNMTKGLLKLVNQRVEFLHRTVKDFVLTRDMGEYLRGKLPAEYNGFTSIATAYLAFLKTTSHDHLLVAGIVRLGPGQNSGPFISHLNLALTYISEALKSEDSASASHHRTDGLLDEYEKAIDNMVRIGHLGIRDFHPQNCHPRLPFREELLRHNLTAYIIRRCQEKHEFFDIFDEPPLFAALMPMSISTGESPAPVSGILELILQRGDDPNERPRMPNWSDAVSPWVIFTRSILSVFNWLSGPLMFPALRLNDSLNNGLFDLLLAHGANPNQPLLDRRGAHTAFSHFLDISLSKFLGTECFDGYLRTLDAFLRGGASLGVPIELATDSESEEAFGNLARPRPDESVLASYCTTLATLLARLAADAERARFVAAVTEKVIFHCNKDEDLRQLSVAIPKGCPENISEPLLQIIERELEKSNSRKRHRESWSEELSVKYFKSK